ncbi:hypothetical protein HPB50_026246 [Hyalomma asiaticum]|uniref:Uncharacterized protein n=1 Tax=Hyalomma asiaticum TaxID=266040 RepID=A0ACB7SEQ5_HYAAI|nr:hypothetical protein HPB50_026246 [Hyalomma asiaticum]
MVLKGPRHPLRGPARWLRPCGDWESELASHLLGLLDGLVLKGPAGAPEAYLERRFRSGAVRTLGSLSFITNTGGMKAVVWTDTFQMTVMVLGLAFVVVLLDTQSSVSLWNVLLGTSFIWLASYGTSQTQVQRFCSVSSLRKAKIALYVNIPGVMINISLGCVAGLVIYANYPDCDPLKSGKISKQDQLIPFFVMKTLSVLPGLPGLFVACVFSGALSTLSSGFNSLAAVTWEDFIKKWSRASEKKAAYITKAVGKRRVLPPGDTAAFAMSGALSGPLLGVFLLGMVLPSCNGKGALCGLLLGQVICLWVVVGSLSSVPINEDLPTSTSGCLRPDNTTMYDLFGDEATVENIPSDRPKGIQLFYRLSHLLVPVLGFVVTVFTSTVVSLFTGMNEGQLQDPELFTRCVAKRFIAPDDKEAGKSMVTVDGVNDPSIRDQPEVSISNVSKDRASTNL